ncbi:MAG: hypothetical protein Q8P18_28670 [Pseudomonadota bacterium]|nr:hypothetical protein [Pseudomonadota bacterium]
MYSLVFALLACAPHPVASTAATSTAAAPAPDTISPPVTLDQFRAAFSVGTRIRLSIAASGAPIIEQRWTWTAVDDIGCTIATTLHDETGAPMPADPAAPSDQGPLRHEWAELMGHAVFPAARTTMIESTVDVPAGHFATWLYTVQDTEADGTQKVTRYHFAQTMPGPPLLMITEVGGVEVFRMTMLERTQP